MNLKETLIRIATIVADEAARNPDFQERLEAAIVTSEPMAVHSPSTTRVSSKGGTDVDCKNTGKRRGGRRSPAVLDPIDLAVHGEAGLREQLATLELELLHDIVAQYGMDPGKLVMKWRDRDRVINRIVEVALARATKGDAFRKE